MVVATIMDEQGKVTEELISYNYPGYVTGSVVVVNGHGLCITGNYISSKYFNPNSLRKFI